MKEALVSSIGETEAICPYCRNTLEKKPGAKKKCPHCANYIYVRTRPHDQQKILVKESELSQLEYLWEVRTVLNDIENYGETSVYLETEKRLKTQWHQQPSLQDVVWQTGMKMAMQHASNLDFGFYRNAKSRTADYLQKLRDNKRALILNLEVCYIDLNGPENRGGWSKSMLKEYPAFSLNWTKLAPGIIQRVKTIMDIQNISIDEVKQIFLYYAEAYYKDTKTPVPPLKAWASLEKELRA